MPLAKSIPAFEAEEEKDDEILKAESVSRAPRQKIKIDKFIAHRTEQEIKNTDRSVSKHMVEKYTQMGIPKHLIVPVNDYVRFLAMGFSSAKAAQSAGVSQAQMIALFSTHPTFRQFMRNMIEVKALDMMFVLSEIADDPIPTPGNGVHAPQHARFAGNISRIRTTASKAFLDAYYKQQNLEIMKKRAGMAGAEGARITKAVEDVKEE